MGPASPRKRGARGRSEVAARRAEAWLSGRSGEWTRRFGASPPMRITASWSGSSGSAEYKYVARWSAPCGEFPLGRCALNQSQAAVNEDEWLGRIRPYRSGLDTSIPHTSSRLGRERPTSPEGQCRHG